MQTNYKCKRANKAIDASVNEDAVLARKGIIAVSDGAGGYGIFAEQWASYILENLPHTPFGSFEAFAQWSDNIWQPFYNKIESQINTYPPNVQNKFNAEGSCATLAAVWHTAPNVIEWCCYGDSAVFVYSPSSNSISLMSNPSIVSYRYNPPLINWKTEPSSEHFRTGTQQINNNDIVFVASDALACFITMAYYATTNPKQLNEAETDDSYLAVYANRIQKHYYKKEFYTDILAPLLKAIKTEKQFTKHLHQLHKDGLLINDDYSLAVINSV